MEPVQYVPITVFAGALVAIFVFDAHDKRVRLGMPGISNGIEIITILFLMAMLFTLVSILIGGTLMLPIWIGG